jgi:hypothetical protein
MKINHPRKLSWCQHPKASSPRSLTRIPQPWKNSRLLYTILIAVLVAAAFLSLPFLLYDEADGWSYTREIDRIGFPGGAIVVYENSQSPGDKAYITISVEANIASEEDLAAYVESRTKALNSLLETVAGNATIEAIITFKDPLGPEAFARLCENWIEKPGEYAVILHSEDTNTVGSEVVWFPRPLETDFTQNLTSTFTGYELEGIIAFECYVKADAAKNLLSNQAVLLIDSLEDPQILEIKQDCRSRGFDAQVSRAFFEEMWKQYVPLLK